MRIVGALALLLVGHAEGYAFECPPPGATENCPESFFDRVPLSVERTYRMLVDRLLLSRSADVRAAEPERHEVYSAALAVFEGFRIVDCLLAYPPPCVVAPHFERSVGVICSEVESQLRVLSSKHFVAEAAIMELQAYHACWQRGAFATSRDVALQLSSRMVQDVVRDCDLDLVTMWDAVRSPFPKNAPLAPESAPLLLYPAAFSPPGECDPRSFAAAMTAGLLPVDEPSRPWRDVSGQFSMFLSVGAALKRLERRGVALSRFVVNLGAADGACGWGSLFDPANCLLKDKAYNATTVLFEGAKEVFPLLWERFGSSTNIHLRLGFTSPRLAARDVSVLMPKFGDIDLLKVDVDNCDACFVDALLQSGARPKLIHVEITDFIPPDLAATMVFNRRLKGNRTCGELGECMCGSVGEFLRVAPGYWLLHIEYVNALLVREDLYQHLAGAAEMSDDDKWRLGWLCHPLRTLSDWSHSTIFRRLGKDVTMLADRRVPVGERRRFAEALFEAK